MGISAVPCISISYIIIILAGKWVFRERIDKWKIWAIILILAGVVCLGYSEQPSQDEGQAVEDSTSQVTSVEGVTLDG